MSTDDRELFATQNREDIQKMADDSAFKKISQEWLLASLPHRYSYHFSWLGMPVIQYPQDMMAIQELIWAIQPELIVETGVARGGSVIFHASLLELIGGPGHVLGIDIEIRPHNRKAIEAHPLAHRITLLEGSSINANLVEDVYRHADCKKPVLVLLDSMHTHDHVLEELRQYSPLVSQGSYLVVLDTVINDIPDDRFENRPWNQKNNPKTAVHAFLKENSRFVIDSAMDAKLGISVAPSGYLKCIKN